MAIEQAPVEINLREPRRPSHDFYALLWLGGWGAAAAIALSALVLTSQTPTANERLRSIFAINEHPLAAPDRRQGKSGYRLVVGPLPNGPAATGLCAHFNAAHTACPSVKFDGEQIAQR